MHSILPVPSSIIKLNSVSLLSLLHTLPTSTTCLNIKLKKNQDSSTRTGEMMINKTANTRTNGINECKVSDKRTYSVQINTINGEIGFTTRCATQLFNRQRNQGSNITFLQTSNKTLCLDEERQRKYPAHQSLIFCPPQFRSSIPLII